MKALLRIIVATWFCVLIGSFAGSIAQPKPEGVVVKASTAETPSSANGKISKPIADIVKLTKAGIDPKVIETYIRMKGTAYFPTAEDLVYMKEQGVAKEIMALLIQDGGESQYKIVQAALVKDEAHEAEIARIRASMHGWLGGPSIYSNTAIIGGPWAWSGYPGADLAYSSWYSYNYMGLPHQYGWSTRPARGAHMRNVQRGARPLFQARSDFPALDSRRRP